MRRTLKKNVNLNSLKTGCSPCMNEAKKMQRKISDRNLSEIIQEIKSIVSSLLKTNKYLTFCPQDLNPQMLFNKSPNFWYISSFAVSLFVAIPLTVFSSYFSSTSEYMELLKQHFKRLHNKFYNNFSWGLSLTFIFGVLCILRVIL